MIFDFAPVDGAIGPEGYLVIITAGLAPAVNVESLALVTEWQIGDKLALSTSGEMKRSAGQTAAGGEEIVVGKVAGPVDAALGTLPLFINID